MNLLLLKVQIWKQAPGEVPAIVNIIHLYFHMQ